ncbi:HPr family phosphocarrier protein [Xylanimonas ulmi]|uniref:Phosphocarrier protein HPr n=1 Tax=Xylanimonas ulmi TaxID=228973 RepID=A0A4Q7M1X2_9MICO|nr:HPr family phosphocarrier protein [Xylanibacterium ulmi]RZS60807.1 phosphocarrier protein HPr [Xylanibacterium ulmi]
MPTRHAVIASSSGLHARPAALFTQAVAASGVPVTLTVGDGAPIDASSILMVMALGVAQGAHVRLDADGPDAERVLDELVALLETDLDAPQATP